MDKDASYKICNYDVTENSQDLEPISQPELQGTLQSLISDTPIQDKFKNGQVSRRYVCKFVKRHSTAQGGPLFTEFPQTMTPLRAEWTTFANIKDWYDISAQTMLDTPNQIAVANPAWDKASVVEQESGEIDRLLIRSTHRLHG